MKEGLKNMDALGNTSSEWVNAMNEIEHEPAPVLEGMTDAELSAVVLHDPELATRRKALTLIRMREYKAGADMAVATFERVNK